MSKFRMIALLLAAVLCFSLAGCGDPAGSGDEQTQPEYEMIKFKDTIPPANVDISYDLDQILIPQDDVQYDFTAVYTDPKSGDDKKLRMKNNKITPKEETEIRVTIQAQSSTQSETANIIIPIEITYDMLDKLLATGGAAGAADSGVTKELTKDSAFIKAENSVSSLKTTFQNPAESDKGTKILDLSHYSLMAYFNSRVWDNSAVTMWVYNPMDQDAELKLTSFDSVSAKTLSWSSPENTQVQVAKAGEWTQVNFSLYQMHITNVLYNTGDVSRTDSLELHARYGGSDSCTLYIDGVDVVAAEKVAGLQTGYVEPALPSGDFSDLLETCKVYNGDSGADLERSTNGKDSKHSYSLGTDEPLGYPTFYVDLPGETDISGFDYLKFDVYAEKAYPNVSVAIRYIDENGEVKHQGTGFDFYREQWRTIYLNLNYLSDVDLTRVVGFNFSMHAANRMVEGEYNKLYFDNICLYEHSQNEPELPAPTVEDHDLLSGPMQPFNIKPGTSGVCKVSKDETGTSKSNSTLLFWTNNACGYPNVYTTFYFDYEQDWSDCNVLNFDTHQFNGHYWMGFTLLCLDETGKEYTLFWRHDTVLTNWMTNSAPLSWFTREDGTSATDDDFKRVVGLKIAVDMAVNVTDEVAMIFFDNFVVS